MRRSLTSLLLCLFATAVQAQTPTQTPTRLQPFPQTTDGPHLISPLTQPSIPPGVITLLQLDAQFADAVSKGGGPAFASWFAEDAVTLNNGKPAILGHRAIADNANWDPKKYQLTWTAQGGQMGPSGDTGFTWGHYDAKGTDNAGQPFTTSGRYITFWKKVVEAGKESTWKVALDASSLDVPGAGDCCALPRKPGKPGGPSVNPPIHQPGWPIHRGLCDGWVKLHKAPSQTTLRIERDGWATHTYHRTHTYHKPNTFAHRSATCGNLMLTILVTRSPAFGDHRPLPAQPKWESQPPSAFLTLLLGHDRAFP